MLLPADGTTPGIGSGKDGDGDGEDGDGSMLPRLGCQRTRRRRAR